MRTCLVQKPASSSSSLPPTPAVSSRHLPPSPGSATVKARPDQALLPNTSLALALVLVLVRWWAETRQKLVRSTELPIFWQMHHFHSATTAPHPSMQWGQCTTQCRRKVNKWRHWIISALRYGYNLQYQRDNAMRDHAIKLPRIFAHSRGINIQILHKLYSIWQSVRHIKITVLQK